MARTIYRKDYTPPVFYIDTIALDFVLGDTTTVVKNTMQLRRNTSGDLCLRGEALTLLTVSLDGRILTDAEYTRTDTILTIPELPEHCKIEIVTHIAPHKNTQLSGLYYAGGMFCTQCEAEGFRRITYHPDTPDVLSVYTTRISADKARYPVLLSNGNRTGSGDLPDGRHWVSWSDPFKKPSYLFALVAGDLAVLEDQYRTQSGRTVQLAIYVEPRHLHQCAHAMASLKQAMRWDETEYGREYDLDLYMIVAVSDFNMGAMENKGLNIFNAKYVLAEPGTATDDDYMDIQGVIAHEYFHNWTGNRVTCRDWFQLSLKEGLTVFRDQEFSRDMNSRAVNRIMDVKALLATQFPEDASPLAHPVRPESYEAIDNFYTATIYNKGAEVIRMQQTLLSEAGFRRGMDLYFERHDGQAVTIDDFVDAMSSANAVDLTQFKRWYSQAGTPVVRVETAFQDGALTLTCTQSCRPTPENQEKQPFHIPIRMALFTEQGEALAGYPQVLALREAQQTFHFTGFAAKPYLSLLRDFSAPIELIEAYDPVQTLGILRFETDGYAKWRAATVLILQVLETWMPQNPAARILPEALVHAFAGILEDKRIDNALKAELFTPLSFEACVQHFTAMNVDTLMDVRDAWVRALGTALFAPLTACYSRLVAEEDHAVNAAGWGRRKLKNICLLYLMKAREHEAQDWCVSQYRHARTMTDQLQSFTLLAHGQDHTLRVQMESHFYEQWQHETLVIDKWFSVLASYDAPGTLTRVEQLMQHPAFSMKNPNKVRALLGGFAMNNPRQFHAVSGQGYAWLAAQLIVLDVINPQIAARLATPLTRWQRYDVLRQGLMRDALHALQQQKLSKNMAEIIAKSLGG